MPAEIKVSEITWQTPVRILFGVFASLTTKQAQQIMRGIINASWPDAQRFGQSVYIIRLTGVVAVQYPEGVSPVIYIGEGDAYSRLYGHTNWLVPLVQSVPQLGVEVCVARVQRRNQPNLYKNVEADLIRWFSTEYGSIPWFNRQWERSKENQYSYSAEASASLWKRLSVGSGHRFLWAIQPTLTNELRDAFSKGVV